MEKLTGCGRYACLFLFIIYSCSGLSLKEAGPKGVYHRVKSGETLSAIARAYRVDLQSIAEINNITDASLIEKDSVIFIPNAQKVIDETQIISRSDKASAKIVANDHAIEKRGAGNEEIPKRVSADKKRQKPVSEDVLKEENIDSSEESKKVLISKNHSEKAERRDKEPKSEEAAVKKQEQIRFNKNLFTWPVAGKVISFFGVQSNGMFFNGIKIASAGETAVLAAREGAVIRSERLKYYGETIIIQHADDYATVYANLAVRAVDVKSRVKKGDRIGFIGKVSGSEELHLYFEIRHKNKARNPLFFLP
jgi:lipoprotein NlpD